MSIEYHRGSKQTRRHTAHDIWVTETMRGSTNLGLVAKDLRLELDFCSKTKYLTWT